ncbi:hypothetical protein [Mesorhizobium sp.]|uniref:hypothetical protein n=1 Tax=Mesorhizobium sp. TaxID=1871066 RepID=UPI0026006F7E|nr:hypothetical protein [Mesorhizobium sp.]
MTKLASLDHGVIAEATPFVRLDDLRIRFVAGALARYDKPGGRLVPMVWPIKRWAMTEARRGRKMAKADHRHRFSRFSKWPEAESRFQDQAGWKRT